MGKFTTCVLVEALWKNIVPRLVGGVYNAVDWFSTFLCHGNDVKDIWKTY